VKRANQVGWGIVAEVLPHPKLLAILVHNFDPRSGRGQALPTLGEVIGVVLTPLGRIVFP